MEDMEVYIERTVKTIGTMNRMNVICYLMSKSKRFNELKADLKNISPTSLSRTLKFLIGKGIVEKKIVSDGQDVITYNLSRKGKQLFTTMNAMADWGSKYGEGN